jgi:Na+/H+ antiporter NhaD/arsenite permease-like protein
LKVPTALARLDTSGILFFLGILMSIGVLDKSGLLKQLAVFLSDNLPSIDIIATAIGLFSALIDNVPLVAATMYVRMERHRAFWHENIVVLTTILFCSCFSTGECMISMSMRPMTSFGNSLLCAPALVGPSW